jgi:hypothetical protein
MDFAARSFLEVGLLSDTHIPYRMKRLPSRVFDALAGVDLILHAGDVDQPAALDPLRELAPVFAVRGNVHVFDLSSGGASLPAAVKLSLAGRSVVVTHGYLRGLASFWYKGRDVVLRLIDAREKARFNARVAQRLTTVYPRADIIVFGHTHRAVARWFGDTLLVNPGAVCPTLREVPTVARMTLDGANVRVDFLPLERPLSR